jgi:hypothetical protein
MNIYPFSKLDSQLFIAEVWPRFSAVIFDNGQIIKNYDEFTRECFIIFDGEVSVFSKIYGYVQETEDK